MNLIHLGGGGIPNRASSQPNRTGALALPVALVIGGVLSAYLAAFAEGRLRLVGPGLLAAVVAVLVAGYNAYGVVLSLVVVRSSLDWFTPKQVQGGGLVVVSGVQPGVLVGAAVLALGVAWLAVQIAAQRFQRPSAIGISLLLFSSACVATSLGADSIPLSVSTSLRVVIGLVLFLMVEQMILADPARIRSLLVAIGLSLVLPAINSINELAHRTAAHSWVQGPFVNRNSMAIWLSVCIPLFVVICRHLTGWAKAGAASFSLLASILLLFTYCRAAYVGVLCALLVVAILQERWLLIAGTVLVLGLWFLVPSVQNRFADLNNTAVEGQGDPNSFAFRERYWGIIADDFIKDKPIIQNVTGIGLGMVEATESIHLEPHNVWVQVVAETGGIGTATFVIWIITTGAQFSLGIHRMPKKTLERAIAIGAAAAALNMLVQTISQNLITEAVIWTYFSSVLALGSAVTLLHARGRGSVSGALPEAPQLASVPVSQPTSPSEGADRGVGAQEALLLERLQQHLRR